MGRLRTLLKTLRRDASETMGSFELVDGSTYFYDRLETSKELFTHCYDSYLGMAWPEPPEFFRMLLLAKDPAAVLEQLRPENPQGAFVNPAELYDTDALVYERRLVPLTHTPVEDLSE